MRNRGLLFSTCSSILFIFSMLICGNLEAQSKIEGYSGAVKLGFNVLSDQIFEGVETSIFNKNNLYTLGYYYGEDYELWTNPTEEYNQFSLLYGKFLNEGKFRLQAQAGLGLFWGIKRTDELDRANSTILSNAYYPKKFTTIGLPLKLGVHYVPWYIFSIGIELQANINLEKSIVRPMLSLEFGKLRKKKYETNP